LSLPTAAIGVALGFLWAGAPFAEGAFIGVVLLVGIAANDSILLADRYRQLRQDRPHGAASVLARLAVRERLRPMWTTTISTVVAMLPLLVFPQESDFWLGLAVTVTAGLFATTLLAPVATVALIQLMNARPPRTA
jgi:multidrug efflux pump subunit AcrB